ncbi:MAG: VCBS repeat-containing protein [Planctomycetes bacterium]|nr:VCBS repeat-containing protein [Planctomycetota bacterium]
MKTAFAAYAAVFLCAALLCGCGDEHAPPDAPANETEPAKSPVTPPDDGRVAADNTPEALGQFPSTSSDSPQLDPAGGDWSSEAFSRAADGQLKIVEKLLTRSGDINVGNVATLVDDRFNSTALRPADLSEAYRSDAIVVQRQSGEQAIDPATARRGPQRFAEVLGELQALLRGASDVRSKFKTVRVRLTGEGATTSASFQIAARTPSGSLQINATWHCGWTRSAKGEKPKLLSLRVSDYEQITGRATGPMFADCTAAVLGANASFNEQLRPGVDHWLGIIETRYGLDVGGWQGLAVGDVNGDGLDDLYVCQPGGLPNLLFVQNPDGTASDRSAAAGVDWLDSTHGALLVDLDNDGDQDLVVGTTEGLLLAANDGRGKFTVVGAEVIPAAIPYSLAAADYDGDGDLDLFVCCYNRRSGVNQHLVFARPVPYHDANNGGRNVLLRNDGSWRMTHVTGRVGLDQNNRRFSYAAAWEDFDNDGDLDLYVANDFGRNNLYRNEVDATGRRRFVDVAAAVGVEDVSAGMSVSWGDYDNDGRMDLYVSNMFSSAGNRISYQPRFQSGADEQTLSLLRRHARGNSLFKNEPDGTFRDVSVESAVTMGRWAWGSKFADLNNDGLQDLIVTNGFITQDDPGDL